MKQARQPISVVVPTLNEAGNISALFERIHKSLHGADIPYEIIVVDDHSDDGTASLVHNADSKFNARLLTKQGKPGKAFSLLEGFANAQYELVCMIDADLQYPPEAITLMYHKLQYCEADIVLTERVDNQTGWLRKLSSRVFNLFFVRLLFGINYDTQSGQKLFRKSILQTISVDPSPWTFDLEFIVRALEQHYVIVSLPIPFSARAAGTPKVHLLQASLEIASQSLRLRRHSSIRRVKTQYRQLQRSFNLFLAATVVALAGSLIAAPRTNALSLSPHQLIKEVQSLITSTPSTPSSTLTPASQSPTTSSGTNTTGTAASQPSSASPTTSTGASTTSNPTNAAATGSGSSATPTTTSSSSAPATTTSSAAKTTTANPSNFSSDSSNNSSTQYYPTSKLSSNKTQTWLKIALYAVATGAACILIGGLIIGSKKLIASVQRRAQQV